MLHFIASIILQNVIGMVMCEPPTALKDYKRCYHCVSKPMSYSNLNVSALGYALEEGGIKMPTENKHMKGCNDAPSNRQIDFREVYGVACSSACVKINGVFQGEAWAYRACWDDTWTTTRPFETGMQDRCFFGLTFIEGSEDNVMCFCFNHDLCNYSQVLSHSSLITILAVFTLYVLNLY